MRRGIDFKKIKKVCYELRKSKPFKKILKTYKDVCLVCLGEGGFIAITGDTKCLVCNGKVKK